MDYKLQFSQVLKSKNQDQICEDFSKKNQNKPAPVVGVAIDSESEKLLLEEVGGFFLRFTDDMIKNHEHILDCIESQSVRR